MPERAIALPKVTELARSSRAGTRCQVALEKVGVDGYLTS